MQQLSDKMIAGWNAPRAQVTDEIEMALVESPNTSADSADNYRGAIKIYCTVYGRLLANSLV